MFQDYKYPRQNFVLVLSFFCYYALFHLLAHFTLFYPFFLINPSIWLVHFVTIYEFVEICNLSFLVAIFLISLYLGGKFTDNIRFEPSIAAIMYLCSVILLQNGYKIDFKEYLSFYPAVLLFVLTFVLPFLGVKLGQKYKISLRKIDNIKDLVLSKRAILPALLTLFFAFCVWGYFIIIQRDESSFFKSDLSIFPVIPIIWLVGIRLKMHSDKMRVHTKQITP